MIDEHGRIIKEPLYKKGDLIDNRFLLINQVGKGGMAEIWKCEDSSLDRKYHFIALRLPREDWLEHPEIVSATNAEHARNQIFNHPNIETTIKYGYDEKKQLPYTCMRLMEGETLAAILKDKKINNLPMDWRINVAIKVSDALAYIHRMGYVYSDIKPGKIFLEENGSVKLFNFALTRQYRRTSDERFDPGILGALTPAYACIEVLEGEYPDPKDDIYSFGLVLYELFSGIHPFNKMPAHNVEKYNMKPKPISWLTGRQNRTLRHALELHAQNRIESIEELMNGILPQSSFFDRLFKKRAN